MCDQLGELHERPSEYVQGAGGIGEPDTTPTSTCGACLPYVRSTLPLESSSTRSRSEMPESKMSDAGLVHGLT
jgi:hypothetical protein